MNLNFTPGPSQLYFTVQDHFRKAIRENIGSLSHRSSKFESTFIEATEGLRELLAIPTGHHIFFTASATEIWERIIQNLVEARSFHLVNGAFSKRFYEIALQAHKQPVKTEVPFGKAFADNLEIPAGTELIAVTHNETSTGVALPLSFVHDLKRKNKSSLLVVDAVSSLPYPDFNYSIVDSVFFSVQKGFGLPPGLGVWIVNDDCIAKAESLLAKGISIGSYHSLPTLLAHAKKKQTPETPNVLAIYLLGKVVRDMLRTGIEKIRKETEYKAALLYHALEHHPHLHPLVTEKTIQSKTVVTVDCGMYLPEVITGLRKHGIHPGDGYGDYKKSHLRFANFPAHSKEQFELLVDTVNALTL